MPPAKPIWISPITTSPRPWRLARRRWRSRTRKSRAAWCWIPSSRRGMSPKKGTGKRGGRRGARAPRFFCWYTGAVKAIRRRQDGYALLVILLALSVVVLALAKAVPAWKTEIQRERENRMIDHAREYRMAIKRYFHKNGRYPASIDVLLQKDGNGIRYLRQA